MTNHPSRTLVAAARRIARANGYGVSRHCLSPSLDGWLIDAPGCDYVDERQTPIPTQSLAWIGAATSAIELLDSPDAAGVPAEMQGAIQDAWIGYAGV